MSFVGSNILAGASGQGDAGYKIEKSLRFNSADDSSLTKSFSTATNRKKFTFACWVKRTGTDEHNILVAGSGSANCIRFAGDSTITIKACGGSLSSSGIFRDPSSWYHIVVVVNSTEATQSDRIKLYVNGVLDTLTGTGATLNGEADFNSATTHYIGKQAHNTSNDLSGYLADVQFIDGQALAATDFGEFDENGIWQAKEFEGSYVTGVAESTGAKPIHNTTDNFGQVKGTGTRTDSNSSYLVLAIPMDGSNAGSAFADESANIKGSGTAKGITNSNVTTSTSSSQFYGSSGDFSANSAKLTIGSSNDFAFGTGDFTIEWWMNFNSIGGTPYDTGSINTAGNIGIFIDSYYFYVRASGTDVYFAWSSVGVSTGEWHHYAVVRENGTMSIYLDGVSVSSGTNNANITATTAYVGVLTGYGYGTNGYQQDLRVYKGLAKYTSNFTVPPKASNSFYLKFEDNSTNAALGTDSSGNNSTWTVNNITANGVDYISSTTGSLYSGSWDQAFNGSTTTPAPYIYNTTSSVTLSTSISGVIEIYTSLPGTYAGNPTVYTLSNGATYSKSTTGAEWISFGNQTNVTSISVNAPDPGTYIFAIRVDGSILVSSSPESTDSVFDTPTPYEGAGSGNAAGNYATLNSLHNQANLSIFDGNLNYSSTANYTSAYSTIGVTSGKWYFEGKVTAFASDAVIGVSKDPNPATWIGNTAGSYAYEAAIPWVANGGANQGSSGYATYTTGDIISVAFDLDSGKVFFAKNNVWQNSSNPSLGSNPAFSNLTGGPYFFGVTSGNTGSWAVNFGQRAFKYTPPTGYKALCTTNLPDPTIEDGSKAFDIVTWTGDGSGARTVSGLNLSDSPDLVWSKTRNHGYHNNVWDILRGYGSSATALITDYLGSANGGKLTSATASSLTFSGGVWHNENARTYVAWAWDSGTSDTSVSAGGLNSSAYDQSQTWTNQVTGTAYSSSYAISLAFSGTLANASAIPANNNELVFTPSPSFANAQTVEIIYYYPTAHANAMKINGTAVGDQVATTSGKLSHTFNVSGFTSFSWSRQKYGSEDVGIYGIKVDGVLLADSGVTVKNAPTIATTYRANPNYGFSISKADVAASLTGGPTIAHGLNAKPDFIIGKNVDSLSIYWRVFHKDLQENHYLGLNRRDAEQNSSAVWGDNNSLDSNVFQIGSGTPASMWIPSGTDTCIFYAWSEVEGYSNFGSYTGNGSVDGPFVYTGFRPKWILVKNASTAGDEWMIYDTEREQFNVMNNALEADTADSENTGGYDVDIVSNGFKPRASNVRINGSTNKYIYAAFAEHPFKSARAR